MAEENYHGCSLAELPVDRPRPRTKGVSACRLGLGPLHDRFDLSKEPNEQNRFGRTVAINVMGPNPVLKKQRLRPL